MLIVLIVMHKNRGKMCKKKQFKYVPSKIDECMQDLIQNINLFLDEAETVACCCGHGKYNMSIIIQDKYGNNWDICSNEIIKRKKRFYLRDDEGYYYIPEVHNIINK